MLSHSEGAALDLVKQLDAGDWTPEQMQQAAITLRRQHIRIGVLEDYQTQVLKELKVLRRIGHSAIDALAGFPPDVPMALKILRLD